MCRLNVNLGEISSRLDYYLAVPLHLTLFIAMVSPSSGLENNPKLQSSVRWMSAKADKNTLGKLAVGIARAIGYMRPDERLTGNTLRHRLVFIVTQLVYTTVAAVPPLMMLSSSKFTHIAFLVVIYSTAVWNGAGFYIEVFSERYLKQFEAAVKARAEASSELDME